MKDQREMLRYLCSAINVPSCLTTWSGMCLFLPMFPAAIIALVIQMSLWIMQLSIHSFIRAGKFVTFAAIMLIVILTLFSTGGTLFSFHKNFRGSEVIQRDLAKRKALLQQAKAGMYEAFTTQRAEQQARIESLKQQVKENTNEDEEKKNLSLYSYENSRLMGTKQLQALTWKATSVRQLEALAARLDAGVPTQLAALLNNTQAKLDQMPTSYAQMAFSDLSSNFSINFLLFLFAPLLDLLAFCLGWLTPPQSDHQSEEEVLLRTEAIRCIHALKDELYNHPKHPLSPTSMNLALAELKALLIDIYEREGLPYSEWLQRLEQGKDCFGNSILHDLARQLFARNILKAEQDKYNVMNRSTTSTKATLGCVVLNEDLAPYVFEYIDQLRAILNGYHSNEDLMK